VNLQGNLPAIAGRTFTEEKTETNASSIGVLLEYGGRRLLLGADARADVLARGLRRLSKQRSESPFRIDAYKVAHHGSENNTSADLLSTISCSTYLFSTNGGHGFCHPHEPAVARIVLNAPNATLHFNTESDASRPWREPALRAEGGNYVPVYPNDRAEQAIEVRRV
jgi:beta-lactamase superfamily II metal-dependent hydrolase